ncbi:MAG: hypothetical protein M1829_005505 [Trizodia sp. TS-e1964]|nr:MAG: hypothetical protein M1829_005505 [Trizodia sp. TS-e1964]
MLLSIILTFAAGAIVAATPICPETVIQAAVDCVAPSPDVNLNYRFTLQAFKLEDGPQSKALPIGFKNPAQFAPMTVGYTSILELKDARVQLVYPGDEPFFLGVIPIYVFPPLVGVVPKPLAPQASVRYECIDGKLRTFLEIERVHLSAELVVGAPVLAIDNSRIGVEIIKNVDTSFEHESSGHWDIL